MTIAATLVCFVVWDVATPDKQPYADDIKHDPDGTEYGLSPMPGSGQRDGVPSFKSPLDAARYMMKIDQQIVHAVSCVDSVQHGAELDNFLAKVRPVHAEDARAFAEYVRSHTEGPVRGYNPRDVSGTMPAGGLNADQMAFLASLGGNPKADFAGAYAQLLTAKMNAMASPQAAKVLAEVDARGVAPDKSNILRPGTVYGGLVHFMKQQGIKLSVDLQADLLEAARGLLKVDLRPGAQPGGTKPASYDSSVDQRVQRSQSAASPVVAFERSDGARITASVTHRA